MKLRQIKEGIYWLGVIDWDRRLFDALIPLPSGTSYNAYLVRGEQKTALLDTVDSDFVDVILEQLDGIEKLDYVVVHHAEQDHSGALPFVLNKYPECKVVTTSKCQTLLQDFFEIEAERFMTVKDGDQLELGGRTLEFLFAPWVHWPETMLSFLKEEGILFTCDLFGSHLATSDLFATDRARVLGEAKRYYAGIMMPYSNKITKHLGRLSELTINMIAPSHGPVYNDPLFIIEAYHEWVMGTPKNLVVLPFVSMHGSTRMMVDMLTSELVERGVAVQPYDLLTTDLGSLAESFVDAATIVVASPTFLNGAHPSALNAVNIATMLKPKAKFGAIIGSKGWGGSAAKQLTEPLAGLKLEMLEPVECKGVPREETRRELATLAETIAEKHRLLLGN